MTSGIDMRFEFGNVKRAGEDAAPIESGQMFRVLVLGDYSGRGSRKAEQAGVPAFSPVKVDLDCFDAAMRAMSPTLELRLAQSPDTPVRIELNSIDEFEPDSLFARLPLFAQLRELRRRLVDPATFEQAAADMRASAAAGSTPAVADPGSTGAEDDSATLQRLLGSAPASATSALHPSSTGVESAVDRLLRNVVAPFIVPATAHLQQPLIESIDRAISATMQTILHHPHWRTTEGAWRALDQFVRTVEMDGQVLLEVVDAGAGDVLSSLAAADGDPSRMPLARNLAARRLHDGEEEGYALLVALYEFGADPVELALLAGLGALAAGEGAVLLGSAAAPLAMIDAPDAWAGVFEMPVDAQAQKRWQAFRSSWVAPHVGLVWPGVLARLPYGAKTQPVSAFAFEELAGVSSKDELPWRPAALDLASLLARAFTDAGWQMQAESAVELEDLPAFIDRRSDDPKLQAVAEMFMSERQAQAVAQSGIMPLISHRTLPHARLGTWRSVASTSPKLKARW